ncbi:fumarylacetoacetate hydrolase family protein [Natrinema salifodinae]|uniref:2-keto-4-pentenoate hydratase/2-oxohepta-3-ene-1,7-dioic acid hydratase (Catechol pathway) n=1 Tax=Natrinema salifodinae TaxID=1202768 RepID=A0A1I0QVM4_9EURY|nr:fumarylacetoacetate hydrolase family protein [Natrinema salifodinae]SEW31051.1 2-keto-4-pentenoate hydratase/2-oxohepta-3-ene-1,7-dioic acid hydratase (catechol pathway) [Natrinema salifodinae]
MQFVRYATDGGPQWGVHRDDEIVPLVGLREDVSYQQLTDAGFLRVVEDAVDAAADRAFPVSEASLLAPVPRPGKIVCVGLNYHDHAEEQDEEVPERPLLFGKAGTAVTNPGDPIVHPSALEEVDYEVELGVVIGRTAKDVSAADARDYVAGYTAINDVSGRDAQFADEQFFRGKSYDTFAPMGPTLVPDDRLDPSNVDVACRVNGETMQSSNTAEFIFDVDELVEYISAITTLRPGDVISTGTPGGVGIFREPPELLEPGDTVEVEIDGIGTLTNSVVAERE